MIKKALIVIVLLAAGVAGYRWMNLPTGADAGEQRRGNAAMQMRAGVTGQRWGRGGAEQTVIQVEALSVERQQVSPTLPLLGTVNAKRRETITAPQQARVVDIRVEAGDRVEAGQALIELEAQALQWALRQSEATVRQQEAAIRIADRQHQTNLEQLEQARANYERERNLRSQGFADDSSVQQAAEALRNAELAVAIYEDEAVQRQAQLEQARIELEQVQADFEDLTPTAPFNADVVSIDTAESVRVAASETLMTLVDRRSLFAQTQIPLSVYRQVRDAPVDARARVDGEEFTASISGLAATSNTGSVAMELSLPEAIPVLINETIELELSLPPIEAYAVPQNSVYYGDQIYRIVEGRLQAHTVDILGYQMRGDRQWALVDSDDLGGAMTLLTTRLSQPTEGTPVSVINGDEISVSSATPDTEPGSSNEGGVQ